MAAGRVHRGSGELGLVSADDDHRYPSGIGYAHRMMSAFGGKVDMRFCTANVRL
jgi:hypothetical protein